MLFGLEIMSSVIASRSSESEQGGGKFDVLSSYRYGSSPVDNTHISLASSRLGMLYPV